MTFPKISRHQGCLVQVLSLYDIHLATWLAFFWLPRWGSLHGCWLCLVCTICSPSEDPTAADQANAEYLHWANRRERLFRPPIEKEKVCCCTQWEREREEKRQKGTPLQDGKVYVSEKSLRTRWVLVRARFGHLFFFSFLLAYFLANREEACTLRASLRLLDVGGKKGLKLGLREDWKFETWFHSAQTYSCQRDTASHALFLA